MHHLFELLTTKSQTVSTNDSCSDPRRSQLVPCAQGGIFVHNDAFNNDQCGKALTVNAQMAIVLWSEMIRTQIDFLGKALQHFLFRVGELDTKNQFLLNAILGKV
uniref:(northern house mosquito) hypothetical protein n=1 Tax=Culex pipiens TaxID=7175 RepID=A0A8D8JIB0_CULPI